MAIKNRLKLNMVLIERKDEYIYNNIVDGYVKEFIGKKQSNNFLKANPSEVEPTTITKFMNNMLYGKINKIVILQCTDLKVLEKKMGDKKQYKKRIPSLFDEIVTFLENNNNVKVIITVDGINKKSKLYTKLETCAEIIPFKAMNTRQYCLFAKKEFKANNLTITDANLKYFVSRIGNSCAIIHSEVNKLVLLNEKEITKDMITTNVMKSSNVIVFELINAISDKKINIAYKQLQELIEHGTNGMQIIILLQRNFRIVYYLKCGCDATEMGVNKWHLNTYKAQLKKFTQEELLSILEKLLHYEYLLKSNVSEQFALETMIFEILNGKE